VIHSSDKSDECGVFEKTINQKENFPAHIRTHTCDKP
jgi:hypothetical protein